MTLIFETFLLTCHSDKNSEEHLDLVSKPVIPPSIPLSQPPDLITHHPGVTRPPLGLRAAGSNNPSCAMPPPNNEAPVDLAEERRDNDDALRRAVVAELDVSRLTKRAKSDDGDGAVGAPHVVSSSGDSSRSASPAAPDVVSDPYLQSALELPAPLAAADIPLVRPAREPGREGRLLSRIVEGARLLNEHGHFAPSFCEHLP